MPSSRRMVFWVKADIERERKKERKKGGVREEEKKTVKTSKTVIKTIWSLYKEELSFVVSKKTRGRREEKK